MMKKTALVLLTLLVAAVSFSACTKRDADISLTRTNPNQAATGNKTPTIDEEGNIKLSEEPGAKMKTINDFQPIAATTATLHTNKGDVVIKLFRDEAPLTTLNFLTLAQQGFYDGIVFHRVIPDFMAQVGDPISKDESKKSMWGTGGPGYAIADEFHESLVHDKAGVVSMANSGPNSGGSQFFITYEATPWLDGKHAIFGEVTSGMDVIEQIEMGDKINSISLGN